MSNVDLLSQYLLLSTDTIEQIKLGQEDDLVLQYHQNQCTGFEQNPMPLLRLNSRLNFSRFSKLHDLSLSGIGLTLLVPRTLESSLYFANLTSLAIESCNGSAAFLSTIASVFTYVQSPSIPATHETEPRLTKFRFRSESPDTRLKTTLVQFLQSFAGLTTLSLLFENISVLERLPNLTSSHSSTLKSLTVESRSQPRKLLRWDTSHPFGIGGNTTQLWRDSLTDITTSAPKIDHLGTAFPWCDTSIYTTPSPLTSLDLKTLHIRNYPCSTHSLTPHQLKDYATSVVVWMYRDILPTETQPRLDTISIGPTVYASRYPCAQSGYIQEWAQTHHFTVDWARTRFGKWVAMISAVSEKYLEYTRDEKELSGVYESVWLR